jgi:pimeloyl-ACP methyl ester carboxylesterase
VIERRVRVPGGELLVRDDGDGPSIVLLHAGIVDSRAWAPLMPLLTGAGYRTLAYDRRGYGGSLTEDVAYSNRADLIAVLDDARIRRAALVGNSAGGHVAVDTAVEHPDRVAALVTIGASIGGYEPETTPAEAELFAELERLEAAGDPRAVAEFDLRLWVDGPGQPESRVPAHVREFVRSMDLQVAEAGRVFGRPTPLEPRAAQRLDALSMPVLAVAGALDVSDVAVTAQHLEARCPDARAVIVPDVAHLMGLEAPERLAHLILDHLRPLARYT